jgi:serine/threonine protein kinase
MSIIVGRKYAIEHLLGAGKFGSVYQGKNIKTEEKVAIKIEHGGACAKLLKHEASLMKYLYDHDCRNIPSVYWYGVLDSNTYLVMPCYECSLYDKWISYRNENVLPSLEKINQLMVCCIDILESIHKNYVIHRDIKPQNFMYRNGELFLIDFGLSTFYLVENKGSVQNEHITGTPKYISYFIHDGCSPSRRDDLISLGYIYLWLCFGELPWENVTAPVKEGRGELLDECHILHPKNQERKRLKGLNELHWTSKPIYDYLCYTYALDSSGHEPHYEALCQLFTKKP